jgi:hypothetical protein
MNDLIGMRVREGSRMGTVESVSDEAIRLAWVDSSILSPARETVSRETLPTRNLELLTLTEGWQPFAARPPTLYEDLQQLLSLDFLEEAKKSAKKRPKGASTGKGLEKKAREKRRARARPKAARGGGHNPFKTRSKLGPGPRGGTNSKTNKWKCKCPTPYRCLCRAGKVKKVIRIGKPYKKQYNVQYKKWRSKQKY